MALNFLLASQNQHKRQEFADLFDHEVLQITSAPESLDVDETGKTYHENAFLKAQAYYQKYRIPVMADDSGLEVAFLPDKLGVTSARFGGPGLTDADRCRLLLRTLQGVSERHAYFVCVLCFYINPE